MLRTTTRALLLVALLALFATACGGGDTGMGDGTVDETTDDGDDGGDTEATVTTTDSEFGETLADTEGMTLYLFDNDEGGGESTCTDECAENWPPLTVEGDPVAGPGVDESLLSTTERDDGTTQVVYNGHPLYYFAQDEDPGDTNGQGVGDVWWVVGPDGEAVEE